MTKHEWDVAAEQGGIYRVRQVFRFRNEVKMFNVAPPLESGLRLTPATFMAVPRGKMMNRLSLWGTSC